MHARIAGRVQLHARGHGRLEVLDLQFVVVHRAVDAGDLDEVLLLRDDRDDDLLVVGQAERLGNHVAVGVKHAHVEVADHVVEVGVDDQLARVLGGVLENVDVGGNRLDVDGPGDSGHDRLGHVVGRAGIDVEVEWFPGIDRIAHNAAVQRGGGPVDRPGEGRHCLEVASRCPTGRRPVAQTDYLDAQRVQGVDSGLDRGPRIRRRRPAAADLHVGGRDGHAAYARVRIDPVRLISEAGVGGQQHQPLGTRPETDPAAIARRRKHRTRRWRRGVGQEGSERGNVAAVAGIGLREDQTGGAAVGRIAVVVAHEAQSGRHLPQCLDGRLRTVAAEAGGRAGERRGQGAAETRIGYVDDRLVQNERSSGCKFAGKAPVLLESSHAEGQAGAKQLGLQLGDDVRERRRQRGYRAGETPRVVEQQEHVEDEILPCSRTFHAVDAQVTQGDLRQGTQNRGFLQHVVHFELTGQNQRFDAGPQDGHVACGDHATCGLVVLDVRPDDGQGFQGQHVAGRHPRITKERRTADDRDRRGPAGNDFERVVAGVATHQDSPAELRRPVDHDGVLTRPAVDLDVGGKGGVNAVQQNRVVPAAGVNHQGGGGIGEDDALQPAVEGYLGLARNRRVLNDDLVPQVVADVDRKRADCGDDGERRQA